MKRTSLAAALACLCAATTFAADRAEVEAVFQQDVNHYAGSRLIDPWNTELKRERGTVDGHRLVFGDLKLPGEDVKVLSAELRMRFVEEGWSRIPNAELELYDAAEKDGKPLDVVQYRNHKVVGMDPKERVITWKVPAALVTRWLEKPETNRGLRFRIAPDREGPFQMIFRLSQCKVSADRPALVVKYSFTGEAAPFAPEITTNVAGKTFGPRFTVTWRRKRWDPNGTPVSYEVAVAPTDRPALILEKVDAEKQAVELRTLNLPTEQTYQLRLRAVDPTGLASDWVTADGTFRVTRTEYIVWTQDSVTKVQREENPQPHATSVTLAAARNEYESFQVVVSALSNLAKLDVTCGDLAGPAGARIPSSAVTLYRVHYVDCQGEGWLPDSMVPFVDAKTSRRIGGTFGAPFDVAAGTNASVWVELHVPPDATPGDYRTSVTVTLDGKPVAAVPVTLTVWPVTLPATSTLLTYFELTKDTPKRDTLHAMHAHRIDPWFVNDVGHNLERRDGKPVVVWSEEFDKLLEDYFSGALFVDGVPGKSYLFPGGSWDVHRVIRGTDADRIEILKQYEAHYRGKPWIGKVAWFFIDEPKPGTIAKCVAVGRQIKEHCPSIGFLLTTRYNPELVGLVDVWDAIINNEVIAWDAPGPDPYRDEMKKGRSVINCITVNSNTPTSPNLFIHHAGMNTRIWTWVTYLVDQQGIEFWRVNAAPSVTVPKKFGTNAWGDGSLFYRGLPEELGVPEEIVLPSVRLKILRDGIEDFELLSLLAKKDPALAKKLCHRMVQETKGYDRSFETPVQYMSWNWNRDGKGDRQVPGFVVWESSPKRLVETRAAVAAALAR